MCTVEYRIYPRALKQRGDRGRGERKGEVRERFVGREEGRKEGRKEGERGKEWMAERGRDREGMIGT